MWEARRWLMALALACLSPLACGPDEAEGADNAGGDLEAPPTIGPRVYAVEGAWAWCSKFYLYRQGLGLQFHCFDAKGRYVGENRGRLSSEAAAELDARISVADPEDRTVVDPNGWCGNPDAVGTVSVRIGDAIVSFDQRCPYAGVFEVNEALAGMLAELSECGLGDGFVWLESVVPSCDPWLGLPEE